MNKSSGCIAFPWGCEEYVLLPISRGLFAWDQITFTPIGDTLALDDEWWECLSHCVFWRRCVFGHLGNDLNRASPCILSANSPSDVFSVHSNKLGQIYVKWDTNTQISGQVWTCLVAYWIKYSLSTGLVTFKTQCGRRVTPCAGTKHTKKLAPKFYLRTHQAVSTWWKSRLGTSPHDSD